MTGKKLNPKNFYKEFLSQLSGHHPIEEMAFKQSTTQPWKLPPAATWVISFMPDDYSQKHALAWMMNKGLYEAAEKRHLLAQEASKALGRQVYDHEVFSPKAHTADPALGKLWETQLKKKWEAYEPKEIRFSTRDGDRTINIEALNKFIEGQGLPRFTFGGPNGLVEWLEDGAGKWANKYTAGSPISGGEHHDRSGLDLSNPEFVRDQKTGKYFYRFGSNEDLSTRFHPPHDMTSLDEALGGMRRVSGDEIQKAIADSGSSSLPRETLAWVSNRKDRLNRVDSGDALATRVKGAAGGGVKEVRIPDDEWDKVVAILKKGIHDFNDKKAAKMKQVRAGGKNNEVDKGFMDEVTQKWSEAEMQQMLASLLDPEKKIVKEKVDDPLWKRVVINRASAAGKRPGDPGFNHRNYRHSKIFMDLGMEGMPPEERPRKSVSTINYTFPDVTPHDYVMEPEFKNVAVDLQKDILDQGYQMDSDKDLEKDNTIVFRKGLGDYIIADKGPNGNWTIRNVVGSKQYGKEKKWQGAPLVVNSHDFRSHDKFSAPVDKEKAKAIQDNWYKNPSNFADEMITSDGAWAPKSLFDAVKVARSMDFEAFKNTKPSEIIGAGQIAMSQLYGSWPFVYGDPKGIWTKKLPETDERSIYSLLGKAGVSKQEAMQYVDELYKAKEENREPNFPPNVKQAFLQNGYNWRVYQAAASMSKHLFNDRNVGWKEKSGITSKGKEGDEQSIMGNIGDKNSGQAQTSDLRDIKQGFQGGKISKLDASSHELQKTPAISTAQTVVANDAANTTKSTFRNATTKAFPDYVKDGQASHYEQRYKLMSGKLQKINARQASNEDDVLSAAHEFATNVGETLEDNTSSGFGVSQTPPQVRGVLDATGDFLAQKVVDILSRPEKSDSDVATVSAIIHQFFTGPQSLQAISSKFHAGDYAAQTEEIGRYIKGSDSHFFDDLTKNWMPLTKHFAGSQQQPAVPATGAPGTQQQPTGQPQQPAQQMSYYYDPDDDEAQPPLQLPNTGVAQQQQTAVASRNPLAAFRKPLPPTKAEHVNRMPTFKEWTNWKTVKALRRGLRA